MKKRYSLLAALVLTAPLLATGCSGGGDDTGDKAAVTTDDGSTTTDGGNDTTTTTTKKDGGGGKVTVSPAAAPYVKALADNLARAANDDLPMTRAQADCLAPRWVDTIGVDRFKAAGVTPEDITNDDKTADFGEFTLSESEAEVMYDAFGQCEVNLREMMLKSMGGDAETPEAVRKCMEGVLTDEAIKKLMIMGLTQGDKATSDPNDMPPELAGIMGCAFMGMGSGDDSVDSGSSTTSGN